MTQTIVWQDGEPPKNRDLLVKCKKPHEYLYDFMVAYFCSEENKWLLSFCDCATPIESSADFYKVHFWAEIN